MGRAPSGKIRTYIYKKEQKNATCYVILTVENCLHSALLRDRIGCFIIESKTSPTGGREIYHKQILAME